MMKIRLKTLMAGPDGVHQAGEVIEVAEIAGAAMVRGGYGVEVVSKLVPQQLAPHPNPSPPAQSTGRGERESEPETTKVVTTAIVEEAVMPPSEVATAPAQKKRNPRRNSGLP